MDKMTPEFMATMTPLFSGPIIAMLEKEHEAVCAERDVLRAERDALHQGQTYCYIGKDGKPILARDLEDQRDAALARVGVVETALHTIGSDTRINADGEEELSDAAHIARAALANKGADE